VRFLIATRSIREHTEIWWSVRPHQAFPTVEVRICDAQPEFARAVALAGLMTALTAHYARAYEEGRPLPAHPHRLIEENFWRAIRWGMAGELIDLDSGAVMPAGARIEALVEEVSEIASELGIAPHLAALGEPTAAEVYAARLEEGESVREVWPQVVARTRESVVEWLAVREGER
jgi:carboxylate-amine ligase